MAEISELIRPLRRELRGGRGMEGEKRMTRVFDSTGINAAGNLAAGLYGTAANPAGVSGRTSRIGLGCRAWCQITSRDIVLSSKGGRPASRK